MLVLKRAFTPYKACFLLYYYLSSILVFVKSFIRMTIRLNCSHFIVIFYKEFDIVFYSIKSMPCKLENIVIYCLFCQHKQIKVNIFRLIFVTYWLLIIYKVYKGNGLSLNCFLLSKINIFSLLFRLKRNFIAQIYQFHLYLLENIS